MIKLNKKGASSINELPGFFQIIMLVIVFAGLTFIVADKFLDASVSESLTSASVTNESIAYINTTGYTLAQSTALEFTNPVITALFNRTSATPIGLGNATLTGNVITNATTTTWDNVSVSYTYDYISGAVSGYVAINSSTNDLYDYAIGFLGIIILVTMVYLIIRIVSGSSGRKK